MDTELLILIFLVILNIVFLGLTIYLVYFMAKKSYKLFKSREKFSKSTMQERINYLEKKDFRRFFIIGLILIYIIAIGRVIMVYFFPDLGINLNFEEFNEYKLLIESMVVIMPILIIPCYFIIRIALKERMMIKNVPYVIIIAFSSIPPIFASLNIYFTENVLFSVFLIIYGILFAIMAFKFRYLGYKEISKEDINVKKMVEGTTIYVIELETLRPPISFVPYSFKTFFESLQKQRQRFYFINNSNLHQKTSKKLKPYYEDMARPDKEFIRFFIILFVLIFLLAGAFILVLEIYSFLISLLSVGPLIIIITLFFALYIQKRRKGALSEKYDKEIKNAIQELIDYSSELIKKENLNPEDYPIKLRHNDYHGLEYEIIGKNSYIGIFNRFNSIPKDNKENKGYLVCNKCKGYYKLKSDESTEEFESCECGEKLKHYNDIKELFKED